MKVVLSEMEKEIIQEIGHNKLTADFVEAQLNSKANIFVNLEEGLEKIYAQGFYEAIKGEAKSRGVKSC